MQEMKMEMMNKAEVCQGVWTRMSKTSKSVIDYVLMCEEYCAQLKEMVINDEGQGEADTSDHNWIDVVLDMKKQEPHRNPNIQKPQWNITHRTDWNGFRTSLEGKLEVWMQEFHNAKRDDVGLTEQAYAGLIRILQQTGEETIGRRQVAIKQLKPNHRLRKEIAKRNKSGRKWRKACKASRPNAVRLWDKYLGKKEKLG